MDDLLAHRITNFREVGARVLTDEWRFSTIEHTFDIEGWWPFPRSVGHGNPGPARPP